MDYKKIVLDSLSALYKKHTATGEHFKARAYRNALDSLRHLPRIEKADDVHNLPGIGRSIFQTIQEVIAANVAIEYSDPRTDLMKIYGVGAAKADSLVKDHGITSIDDLRDHTELLNDKQKIGLKYYEDLQERIPRRVIDKFAEDVLPKYVEIMGSYRRGAASSGDIDILVNSKEKLVNVIESFADKTLGVLAKGPHKFMGIVQLDKPRRVDVLYCPPEEYPFAILYFTGSAEFNVAFRQYALDRGFTINEKAIVKLNGEHIDYTFKKEKDIFEFLGLKYMDPEERIGAESLIPVAKKPSSSRGKRKRATAENVETAMAAEEAFMVSSSVATLSSSKLPKKIAGLLTKLRGNFYETAETMTEKEMTDLMKYASREYYNTGVPIMSDSEYDTLKDTLERRFPGSKFAGEIGAEVAKFKTELPYFMGSMNKIKPDSGSVEKFAGKYPGPYVISDKLDGQSGLLVKKDGKIKIYTRGDGYVGQDVSHIAKWINIPDEGVDDNYVVRGEFIIATKDFAKLGEKKPRFVICGLLNSKTVDAEYRERAKLLKFIGYEVIEPAMKISDQFRWLRTRGFDTATHVEYGGRLTVDELSEILLRRRAETEYEIDGIIVAQDGIHPRNVGGNPDYAFAFKMDMEGVVTTVTDITWEISKDGYIKPTVQFEPIVIDGSTVRRATGYNANFIEKSGIGPGAIVKVIKSGDVIPKIVGVLHAVAPKMPDGVGWAYNDTGIDAVVTADTDDQLFRKMMHYINTMEIDALSEGLAGRLFHELNVRDVAGLYRLTESDLLTLAGFKTRLAAKVIAGIKKTLKDVRLSRLAAASGVFGRGFGEKRLAAVFSHLDLFEHRVSSPEELDRLVESVPGIGPEFSTGFGVKFAEFVDFMELLDITPSGEKKIAVKSDKMSGSIVLFTGFRDEKLADRVIELGGEIVSSMSGRVNLIVRKDSTVSNTKIDKAMRDGIRVITQEDLNSLLTHK
jgi:DNA ligase (NAD+)